MGGNVDPWAGGPRRGVFVTEAERLDPVLTAAAHSDPARAFVTVSPAWLAGVVQAWSGRTVVGQSGFLKFSRAHGTRSRSAGRSFSARCIIRWCPLAHSAPPPQG
jgi:hypothetical protein